MTAEASRADEIVARARALDRHALSAPGELPGCGDRLPRPAARASGARCWGRSRRRCRATPPTGRSRAAARICWRRRGATSVPVDAAESAAGRRAGAADARGRGREARRHSRALAARARDADPCLFRARGGRVAADAGLGAADRRGVSFSRKEVCDGDAVCWRLRARRSAARSVARSRASARWRSARRRAPSLGSALDQRLLGAGLGAGGDRARRAVPRDGIERGRAAGAGLRAQPGGGADDLVEPVPRVGRIPSSVGGKGGGGAAVREYSYSVSLGDRALRGRGLAHRPDLGRRAAARPVGPDLPPAPGHRGPAARSADRGDRGRRRPPIAGRPTSCSRTST